MIRKLLALTAAIALPLPAAAQTHLVAELGTAPLLGQIASTQQLQGDLRAERSVIAAAASGLGLSPMELAQLRARIDARQLTYVRIPRRLDAMSWRSANRVHVLRNVIIPANTMGWEIDIAEPNQMLAVFIPNKCGNLSLIRRPVAHLAIAPVVWHKPASAPLIPGATQVAYQPARMPDAGGPSQPVLTAPVLQIAMSTPLARQDAHAAMWRALVPLAALLFDRGHQAPAARLLEPAAVFAPPPPAALPLPAPPLAGCPTPSP